MKRFHLLTFALAILLLVLTRYFRNSIENESTPVAEVSPSQVVPADIPPQSFAAWAARADRGEASGEIIAMADARGTWMKRLITEDPQRAIEGALSLENRDSLPVAVAKRIERLVVGTGDYRVLAICDHQGGEHGGNCRMERSVEIGGDNYVARVYGSRWKQPSENGTSIIGVAMGEEMALHESGRIVVEKNPDGSLEVLLHGEVRHFANEDELEAYGTEPQPEASGLVLDPDARPEGTSPPTEPYTAYTGAKSHQKGPKTMMVFLVEPSDGAAWTNPPNFAKLAGELDSTSQAYYNYSYQQTWFGPKIRFPDTPGEITIPRLVVTPVLRLPKTAQQYKDSFNSLQADSKAAVEALGGIWTGNGVNDPDHYDRWAVMSNTKLINSTGLAYVGGKFSWPGGALSGGVARHELGHNWGVFHANRWSPANGITRSPDGGHSEYGDGADVMGGGSGDFNPLFKESLGFLEISRGEVLPITTSGTYRLFDHVDSESDNAVSRVRSLLVPVTGQTSSSKRLFLGLRHEGGNDGGTGRPSWNRNAIEIHSDNTSPSGGQNDGSHFLDTTPGSLASGDRDDGGVKIGQTYSETADVNGTQIYGGLHITPLARGAVSEAGKMHEYMDVRVNYGEYGSNQPPLASFASATIPADPGVPVALDVIAFDPDGDGLAFDWRFGDGGYSITSSATQSRSYPAPGFYLAETTVSDMKGGLAEAAAWINVGAQPYAASANPPATLGGLEYRYYQGSFSSMPDFDTLLPAAEGTVTTFDISPRLRNDEFAFVFTGFLDVTVQDIYTFSINADDGVKLWIANELVVDSDGLKSSATETSGNIALQTGKHPVRLEMFHKNGNELLDVTWNTLALAKAGITPASLSRTDYASNLAPQVAITSPADGVAQVVGATLEVSADASDADGIDVVRFFVGPSLLGESDSAPFTVDWTNLPVGTHELTALAVDATGRATLSAPVAVTVVSPPARNQIGINFVGEAGADGTLPAAAVAGGYYSAPNWNNAPGTVSGSVANLHDQTGNSTGATLAYVGAGHQNHVTAASAADFSSANGRLMRGNLQSRFDSPSRPTAVIGKIPYLEYDVFVYFDIAENSSADVSEIQFRLTPEQGPVPPSVFGKNSATPDDGVGDFPLYDGWIGFQEATAASLASPLSERLGNYVVFRGVYGGGFTVVADYKGISNNERANTAISAIQIVEAPASAPRVAVTGGIRTAAEGGAGGSYALRLATAPDSDVTVAITPDAQLAASPASVVFTPADWSVAQVVGFSAVDDSMAEGSPHSGTISHSVSAAGNYSGVASAAPVTVAIQDNDAPTLNVYPEGAPAEAGPVAGRFRFTRSGGASFGTALTIPITVSGTASIDGGDFTLSGMGVSFDTVSGVGQVTLAAGQVQGFVSLLPVDDSEDDRGETVSLSLQPGAGHFVGPAGTAGLTIADDDGTDYFVQRFAIGQRETAFDLTNKKITLTPNGSVSYYASSIENITAFPTLVSGHTALSASNPSSGSKDDGWWAVAMPAKFYGVDFTGIFVGSNGFVSFGSGDASVSGQLTAASHFSRLRIAGYWRDLNVGDGGSIHAGRISEVGQERTVVTFTGVELFGSEPGAVNFQIEMWDDGKLTLTWLACEGGIATVGLSNQQGTLPQGFLESDLSGAEPVVGGNAAPVWASLPVVSAEQGSSFAYPAVALDPDEDALVVSAPIKPVWLTLVDTGNGRADLSGTAPAPGTYQVKLRVSDGLATVDQDFTITVIPGPGNSAPVFSSVPPANVNAGASYSYLVTATDADGHPLVFSTLELPSWLALTDHGNGTATLAGAVPPEVPGSARVAMAVTDGRDSAVHSFLIEVNNLPVVEIISPARDVVVLPDASMKLVLEAVAADDDVLTFSWSAIEGPAGVVFDDATAASTLVEFPRAGSYRLRFSADDGRGVSATELRVDVGVSGPTGVFRESGGMLVIEAENFTSQAAGSGSAGGATWTAETALAGFSGVSYLRALPNTGVRTDDNPTGPRLDYEAYFPGAGTYRVWVRMSGPSSNDDSLHAGINGTLTSTGGGFSHGNSWGWENAVGGNPVSVTVPSAGVHTVNVWMREDGVRFDKLLLSDDAAFTPTGSGPVESGNGPGNVAPLVSAGGDVEGSANDPIALGGVVSDDGLPADPGGVTLVWSLVSGPGAVSFGDAGAAATSADFGQPGPYRLRLTADDGEVRVASELTATVAGVPASGYAGWIAGYPQLTGANALSGADPDKDGIKNLLEMALGLSPEEPSSVGLPIAVRSDAAGGPFLEMVYRRRIGGAGDSATGYIADGLVYKVETSGDFVSPWKTMDGGVALVEDIDAPVPNGDGTESVRTRLKSAIADEARGFLRLKVTEAP